MHKLSTAKSGRFAPLSRKTGTGNESVESADAANERERELRLQMELAEQEVRTPISHVLAPFNLIQFNTKFI